MDRLRRERLVNDSRVVEQVLQARTGSRAKGTDALRAELLKRGAPHEEVERQLSLVTPETQQVQMLELLAKKCKISDSPAKGARMLLSRGFDEDSIQSALDAFFGPQTRDY